MIRPLNSLPSLTREQKFWITFGVCLIATALFVIAASTALLVNNDLSLGKFTYTNIGGDLGGIGLAFGSVIVVLTVGAFLYIFYELKMEQEITERGREIEFVRRNPHQLVRRDAASPRSEPPIHPASTHANGNGNGGPHLASSPSLEAETPPAPALNPYLAGPIAPRLAIADPSGPSTGDIRVLSP